MMSTLKKALYSGNETMAAINTLKLSINLAGMKPTFLRKQIVEMVKTILPMADDHSLGKETRRLAIEFVLILVQFVLTLAEVEKTNPRQLKLATEFEINMKETDNYGSWQGCVERLSNLSDRNDILTVALKVFPAYLAAPKGQKRPAALIALSKSINKWKCQEDVLEDRDEAAVSEVLELLTGLVEPRFLVGQIMEWVKRMWQIANIDSFYVGTRRLAIEFLSKLAKVEEIALWLQHNVGELFEILMNILDYINDDDPDAGGSSNYWRWRKCLDMLYIALGGNDKFYVALEVLPAYLDAPEWQKKHAAFIVLAHSMENCREVTIENLEKVVPIVLSPFPNAHHHWRRAAIEAIQQLLTHLLRFRWHEEVMRTNFELVMSKLLSSFQDDDPVLQKASIDAIEKLARYFGERLQVGCHLVLPTLAEVMNDSPNQYMRGSAASIILDLSEYCTEDNLKEHLEGSIRSCLIVSKEVKEFVTRIRFREWDWQERLSKAWVKLWRNKEQNEERDFSPYLEILMYPVFSTAAQLDPTAYAIWYDRVNIIDEKAMACHVLCFCVDELKELLFPQIFAVVRTLIPFLEWYHDPPVADAVVPSAKATRIAAASAMPKILNSARKVVGSSDPEGHDHAMQYVEKLFDMVIDAINEASDMEPNEDVRYFILDVLNDCVQ